MPFPPLDDWRRPGPTRRQRFLDLYFGLAAAVAALLNVVMARSMGLFVFDSVPDPVEQYAWALAVTVPLIWRRAHPGPVLLFVAAVFIAAQVRGTQEVEIASVGLLAALYAVGAWEGNRRRACHLRVGTIGVMFVWLAVAWLTSADELRAAVPANAVGPFTPLTASLINGVLISFVSFGLAYLFGDTAWLAARRLHLLELQAEQLRAAHVMAEERAVFGERVRIARELHDVVAHHVSVMGIQASAARRALGKDVDKARAALLGVEDGARIAVEELRRMVGVMRPSNEDAGPGSSPGLDRLAELVARVDKTGLTARYVACGDRVSVPESVSQAAYRIVQEAVTNTLKHAHATSVHVCVRYATADLEVEVTDDGRGCDVGVGGGMGLIGMRERVAVHDGTIELGPQAGGGFRVRARFPMERESAVHP